MTRYLKRIINSFDQHSKSPKINENSNGLCGLYNMGNTCYFNSIIQCLSHCSIMKTFSNEIEMTNEQIQKPGDKEHYNGDIALAFFNVVKAIWSGEYSVVTPKAVRSLLCEKYDQFKGFGQQDAQELLLILLEELNISLTQQSLKEKVEVETPLKDFVSTPSEQADDIWKKYLLENNSIITHSFSGQQQQKISCSECSHYSVSYDPFNCISLTIPSLKRQKGFVPCAIIGLSGQPIMCKILVTISPTLVEVQREIEKCLKSLKREIRDDDNSFSPNQIDVNNLHFIVQLKNKSIKKFVNEEKLNLINYDKILAYEFPSDIHVSMKTNRMSNIEKAAIITNIITVFIYIREIKPQNIVLLHNVPIVLRVPSDITAIQLKERVKERMNWIHDENYKICVVDEEGKTCKICSDKLTCTGCMLRDDIIINELQNKQHFIYLSYDCENCEEMKKQIICQSYTITNNQRLQTTTTSLFACLTLFTRGDSFEQIDWFCEQCNKNVKADVDIGIWRPPQILIIHLKRFEFTEKYERIKTNESVVFPPTKFDLKEYLNNDQINESVYYDLFAIVNHSGEIDRGHYFADCLCKGKWYRFNDEKVTPLDYIPTNSEEAYLLFYMKI